MATEEVFQNCNQALARMQGFEVIALSRENELGTQLSFTEAVPYAESLVAIYKRIPISALSDFSDTQLNSILSHANADYNLFKQILDFKATAGDANSTRLSILNQIKTRRDQLFDAVWQHIAYGVARITDTSVLETQARATIQAIQDQASRLTANLTQAKTEADTALAAIRAVASEQGVSQQASYFKEEAENQERLAASWLKYTYRFAVAVGAFAVLSIFLHKIPFLHPEGHWESVQLITSKTLIFAVLGYMLVLAARNYATHKHNSVVNRHRQNALLTYRALVEAASGKGNEDIVLAHAASCIFSPQDTGFAHGKGDSSPSSKKFVMELLTKSGSKVAQ